jgi:aromatic ring-opening dioxygenase LigB subunit
MTTAPKLRRSILSSTALALFAVAFLIVRNELNRLIGEVLSADRHTHSLSDVTGFVPSAAAQDARVALVLPSARLTRISNGLSQVCGGFSLTRPGPLWARSAAPTSHQSTGRV